MKRHLIDIDIERYPEEFRKLLSGSRIYDSSCSSEAKVIYIESGDGFYLKNSAKGNLKTEAVMTDFFASKGLSSKVEEYISTDSDWLLTRRIIGEDCISHQHLSDPERLCDKLATLLRALHETDFAGCPVMNRTEDYLKTAEVNYRKGVFDSSFMISDFTNFDKDRAFEYIKANKHLLKDEVLLHGDYCLPNIILDNFAFSGFIDLGNAGVGDRHIDLFWGAWTFNFNLKTDKYRDRFFDAYGRDKIDLDILKIISVIETFG